MTVYKGRCEAPKLTNGMEIVTDVDFLTLKEGDQLDVRMPGEGPHYTFDMSEPGDLVKGIFVKLWSFADIKVGLQRVGPCRFKLVLTEAHESMLNAHR